MVTKKLIRNCVFCLSSICFFALLVQAADTTKNVFAYPSPFKPNGPSAGPGDGQTGTSANGITFTNTPQSGDIKIFNTSGVVVKTIDIASSPFGSVKWDVKDSYGQLVPDDIYYAIVTSGINSKSMFILNGIGEPGDTFVRNIPSLTPGTITVATYDANGASTGAITLEIKGTETGKVSVVGGAKGFINPANGEKLSIGVKATATGTIKTKIFDGKGRSVREYSASTDGTQATVVQWDGKDSSGRNVPSGVYLIHVEGPGINTTKRTVIIK